VANHLATGKVQCTGRILKLGSRAQMLILLGEQKMMVVVKRWKEEGEEIQNGVVGFADPAEACD